MEVKNFKFRLLNFMVGSILESDEFLTLLILANSQL